MPPQRKKFKFRLDRTRRKTKVKPHSDDSSSSQDSSSAEDGGKNSDQSSFRPTSDNERSNQSGQSEEEEFVPQRRRLNAKKTKDSDSGSNYQEDDDEESSDDNEEKEEVALSQLSRKKLPAKSRRKAKTPKRRGTRRQSPKKKSQESDEDSDEEDEESSAEEPKGGEDSDYSPATRRRKSNSTKQDSSSSSEEDIPLTSPSNRSRNSRRRSIEEQEEEEVLSTENDSQVKRRKSPRKASKQDRQQSYYTDDENNSEAEVEENVPMPMLSSKKKKKKKNGDSDDDYSGGSASSESEADLDLENESIVQEGKEMVQELPIDDTELSDSDYEGKPKAVDIDNEQIGSAEESSSSDIEEQPATHTKNSSSPAKAQRAEIRPLHTTLSSGESSDDEATTRPMKHFPVCSSTEDAITMALLPRKHICVISPDGKSRQCFALETLRMTALKCSNNNTREDNTGTTHKNFLQPPHFRTAMSEDLLDQIASKFGREAMNPEGSYYNRKNIEDYFATDNASDDSGDGRQQRRRPARYNYEADDFLADVNNYMNRQMGSQDVYTCPLCYSEVHRRFNTIDVQIDDENATDRHDPMSVLGYLDNDKFEMASLFCFKRVAQLKKHLQKDHQISTREIQGNELYAKFRVRAADGLLQRWIRNWHGGMQSYWYSGCNQSYLHLLDEIEVAQEYKEILASSDDDVREEAEEYVQKAQRFFTSFEDRVPQAWADMAAPFFRSNDDIRDFLDDGDEGIGIEESHFVARRVIEKNDDESDQNDFTNKLARKYAGQMSSEEQSLGSIEKESKATSGEAEEAAGPIEEIDGFYSEEEVETDEWVLEKQQQPQSRLKRKKEPEEEADTTESGSPAVGKRLKKRKLQLVNRTPSPRSSAAGSAVVEQDDGLQRTTSSKKKRVIVLDDSSSSQELEFD